jgi:hypothetical protein
MWDSTSVLQSRTQSNTQLAYVPLTTVLQRMSRCQTVFSDSNGLTTRTFNPVHDLHDRARVEAPISLLVSYLGESTKEPASLSLVNELFVTYKRYNYTAPWSCFFFLWGGT